MVIEKYNTHMIQTIQIYASSRDVLDLISNLPIEIDNMILDLHKKFHGSQSPHTTSKARTYCINLSPRSDAGGSLCSPTLELY